MSSYQKVRSFELALVVQNRALRCSGLDGMDDSIDGER